MVLWKKRRAGRFGLPGVRPGGCKGHLRPVPYVPGGPFHSLNHVISNSFWLLCGIVNEAAEKGIELSKEAVERMFWFVYSWSAGGMLETMCRDRFSTYLRNFLTDLPQEVCSCGRAGLSHAVCKSHEFVKGTGDVNPTGQEQWPATLDVVGGASERFLAHKPVSKQDPRTSNAGRMRCAASSPCAVPLSIQRQHTGGASSTKPDQARHNGCCRTHS